MARVAGERGRGRGDQRLGDARASSARSLDGRPTLTRAGALQETEGEAGIEATLAARVEDAHGVHDVNALAWCPRAGFMRMLASAGDDGQVRVWAVAEA